MAFQAVEDCQSGLLVPDLDGGFEAVVSSPPARPADRDLHRVRGTGQDNGLLQEIGFFADDLVAPDAGVDDFRPAVLMVHEQVSGVEMAVVGIGIK
jgi:hypothetical protein